MNTCCAPDGSFVLVHVSGVGILKCDILQDQEQPQKNPPRAFFPDTVPVQTMDLSPTGQFLLTWERWKDGNSNNNLRVWDCRTGRLLAAFPQKNLSSESWPYLQWTVDEAFAFLLGNNNSQVRVYPRESFLATTAADNTNTEPLVVEPRFVDKLNIPCTTLSVQRHAAISTVPNGTPQCSYSYYYFTTFAKKTRDKPAAATIYSYSPTAIPNSNLSSNTNESSSRPTASFAALASKSLFQAEECQTRWSPIWQSPACLLTLQTAVDATGQSYYGNSQLWLWSSNASATTTTPTTTSIANSPTAASSSLVAVPLPREGPVQDCHWLSDPTKPPSFVAIAGTMPAMASQHHGVTGAVTFLFGNNVHRNTVAPCRHHSRFVCLAGFGNLAGGMGFWDINKKKLLPHVAANTNGTLRSEPVTMYGWSPDSRWFFTATTTPRMNVDNGVRLYKYTGELVDGSLLPWNNADYQPNLLLEACFVPSLPTVYPDRPQKPVPDAAAATTTSTAPPGNGAAAPLSSSKPADAATAAGRYVPPSARNRTSGGLSLAERMRAEMEGTVQGATKVHSSTTGGKTTNNTSFSSMAGVRVIPGLTVTAAATAKSKSQVKREKLKLKKESSAAAAAEDVATSTAPEATTTGGTDASAVAAVTQDAADPEKRARKLKKILKQLDDLKALSGHELNDDQKAKLASEAAVRAELEQLGLS